MFGHDSPHQTPRGGREGGVCMFEGHKKKRKSNVLKLKHQLLKTDKPFSTFSSAHFSDSVSF